jgi:diguanylate cyclase (GGDEF)-like protein
MENEFTFEGFKELIQKPLEQSDCQSFELVKKLCSEKDSAEHPFSTIIQKLTGKQLSNRDAMVRWRHILENKASLENTLARRVGIQSAAFDYFEQQNFPESLFTTVEQKKSGQISKHDEEWIEKIHSPGFYLEKLKEEILRAKRYNHALSSIMLEIDDFNKIIESNDAKFSDKIITLIIKIIKKTIRTVDIISRYSGERFLLILPNTNKREALELAERLRHNVNERTKRIEGFPTGASITLSVCQCLKEDSSVEFLKRLENTLEKGKNQSRNSVYSA